MSTMSIQQINSSIMFGNLSSEQLDSVVMAVKYARSQMAKSRMNQVRVGSSVKYYSRKMMTNITGRVEKVGRKFLTVRLPDGTMWKVPAHMVEVA